MIESKYFNMGRIAVSQGIDAAMTSNLDFRREVYSVLLKYANRDWGDLSEMDKEANEQALQYPEDLHLFAAYKTSRARVWIFTDRISEIPDDNATIVCFPEER